MKTAHMASTQIETVSSGADKLKLTLAVLLVIAALAAFYLLAAQGALAQWGGLVAGLALATIVFFTSETGKRLIAFGRDSNREVRKVVWPARKTTLQVTGFVFAFTIAIALFLWLSDKMLGWLFYDLILGWRGR